MLSPRLASSNERNSARAARIRLRFRGEVESVLRFVVVEALHAVAVVQKRYCPLSPVYQESVKKAVQASGKGWVLLT